MFIPEEGQRILFVAGTADDGSREIRPGQVIKVNRYSNTECLCNIIVQMNGPNDMQAAFRSGNVMGFNVFLENVPFGTATRNSAEGTWFWPTDEPNEVYTITVKFDISHGREIIKRGAVGILDEQKNTITFQQADVIGLAEGLQAIYPAKKFMDLHAPRIQLEDGREWRIGYEPATTEEMADERDGFMKDLRRQHGDLTYRNMRRNGMPSQYESASLREAREAAEKEPDQTRSKESASAEQQTDTRDDSNVGRMTRLDLEQERKRSSTRPLAAHR